MTSDCTDEKNGYGEIVEDNALVPFPIHSCQSAYFRSDRVLQVSSSFQPLLSYETNTLNQLLKPWDNTKRSKLLKVIKQNNFEILDSAAWEEIAKEVGQGVRAFDCFQQYYNNLNPEVNHKDWTVEEEKNLLALAKNHGSRNWHLIAEELGTGRTPIACLRHYQQTLNPELVNSADWSVEEDTLLRDAVDRFGAGKWQHIASHLPGRSAQQCLNRWRKSVNCHDTIITGKWLEEEERALFLAAYAFDVPMLADYKRSNNELQDLLDGGDIPQEKPRKQPNWVQLSQFVPGKNDVQCREKWNNNLDPTVISGDFTSTEDTLLLQLVERLGEGNWSRIAEFLPGRSDAAVRLRWKAIQSSSTEKKSSKKRETAKETKVNKRKALPAKHLRSNKAKLQPSQFETTTSIQFIPES